MEIAEVDFRAAEAVRVIVDHGKAVVAQADFAAQVGFVGGGHADDVAPTLNDADLGLGLETRAPHLDVNFPRLDDEFRSELGDQHRNEVIGDSRRPTLQLLVVKRRRPLLQSDVIAAGDQSPGRQFALERADGIEGHDVGKAEVGQPPDVGAVVDRMRRQRKAVAMAVDQDMLSLGLVGDRPIRSLGFPDLPGRKERGLDDAGAADERNFHASHDGGRRRNDNANSPSRPKKAFRFGPQAPRPSRSLSRRRRASSAGWSPGCRHSTIPDGAASPRPRIPRGP